MRSRRLLFGMDVVAAAALAVALFLILNFLAARYDRSFDFTRQKFHSLDQKTARLLQGIAERKERVQIATFFDTRADLPYVQELRERVVRLLDRYKDVCPGLEIQHVDLYRDPERAKKVAQEIVGGPVELNSVGFRCGDRHKLVASGDMAVIGGTPVAVRAFKAEDAFSTALNTILLARQPVILYATGHGERSLASEQPGAAGFEGLKELMEQQGLKLKPELLGGDPLEGRADLVIIGGPGGPYLPQEADLLHDFLLHGGKILMLLDPPMARPGTHAPGGLEDLLVRWGVTAYDEVVLDYRNAPLQDNEQRRIPEIFRAAGFSPDSPISRGMAPETPLTFSVARPVEPARGGIPAGLRVQTLVRSAPESWAKRDYRGLGQGPLRTDPRMDRRGPHAMAVQIEVQPLPPLPTASSDITPSGPPPLPPDAKAGGKAVIIGDGDLAANQWILAGANRDFVFNALYWLLEREDSMGISAKSDVVKIVMDDERLRQASLLIQFGAPAVFLFAGMLVWWLRRH